MMDAEVVALLQSPCSLVVATVSASGVPEATRGWAVDVLDGGTRLRVYLSSQEPVTHENIAATGAFAVTATEVATNVSVQVKGRASPIEPLSDVQHERVQQFCDGVIATMAEYNGHAVATMGRFVPAGFVATTVSVDVLFNQTPGPAAGRQLTGSPT
jgi:hypothetical protein